MKIIDKLKQYKNNKHIWLILSLCILLLNLILFFGISIWKYKNFLYNELDLAIFNQVFYNTSKSDWFNSTIQGQNYLGDHFEPLILPLTLIYKIIPHPLTLIFLQLLAINIGGLILYYLVKQIFKNNNNNLNDDNNQNQKYAFIFVCLYVLNYSLQNMSLFGFHMFVFAVPLIFAMLYFYLKQNFWWYLGFLILSLLVREDVALVIIPFAFIPLIEKKSIKWWLTPFVLGCVYFVLSLKIVSFFNIDGIYKFFLYYGWLGKDVFQVISTIITNPFLIFKNIFKLITFELILGLVIPFVFFIPFLGGIYLIPLILIYGTHILKSSNINALLLQTHYIAPFIPFLFVATIFGFKKLQKTKHCGIILILLFVSSFYSSIVLGPTIIFIKEYTLNKNYQTQIINSFINQIPQDAGVVASASVLPHLSSRKNIYLLTYVFNGNKQFSKTKYEVPNFVEYALIDIKDFVFFDYSSQNRNLLREIFKNGDNNFRNFIQDKNFEVVDYVGDFVLFKKMQNKKIDTKNNFSKQIFYTQSQDIKFIDVNLSNKKNDKSITDEKTILTLDNKIQILNKEVVDISKFGYSPIDISYLVLEQTNKSIYLQIDFDGKKFLYPIGLGVLPIDEWQVGNVVNVRYWLPSDFIKKQYTIKLVESFGDAHYNFLGSVVVEAL